ncbi:MAG TPA: hypothetical protein VFE18_16295 [Phenylobacterium sp.]|jgi:hypothetical protein|uniref:hypothetical protein n=1 Tax=Phenylobacterium sp. TaxID=1871053 RepID=UPI002D56BEAC|nr:hypothetical protein [Phenylobacterium sp.]HZZ69734.1 hypothetical protein [Phenylobacterium sp.]
MDAEERIKTAIMNALTCRGLDVLAKDYQQFEDAIMCELEGIGSYHDDGTFVIEADEG